MSSGDQPRKPSLEELRRVQQLMIKQCLKNHMTKEETMTHLASNENVDPALTEYLWADLEKAKPDWLKNYYRRMKEKREISRNNDEAESMHQPESNTPSTAAMAAVQESMQHHRPAVTSSTTTSASTILKTTTMSSSTSDSDSFDISDWLTVDSSLETNKNIPQVGISKRITENFQIIEDYFSQTNINIPQRLADSPSHETNTDNLHGIQGNDEEKQDDRLGKDGLNSKGFSKNG